jgi:SAM-dependent methyltransferase
VRGVTEVERAATGEEASAPPQLPGPRCPRCLGALDAALTCEGCGAAHDRGPRAGTLRIGSSSSTFRQELDAHVVAVLEPLLDELAPPACTETVIAAHAEEAGFEIGNPIWEGRFDLGRSLPQSSGVVLDVGCGFGTSTVAMARSARHVLAVDPSPERVRLTAARLRAEGLLNATAIQADALRLPVGDGLCDLVAIVGVLEWTSFGSPDPLAVQRSVLREVARVLRPGGALLLGIENRYAAHYFAGFREEHAGLPFVSLLPRRLADVYGRLAGRGRITTYTHSRRRLLRLLRDAELEARVGLALPSYGQPQLVFAEEEFRPAWDFYLRHVFHYSSPARRAVGALAAHAPPAAGLVAPGFFAVARKGPAPDPLPTLVTGTPDCSGDIKTIDWSKGEIAFRPRLGAGTSRVEPLLGGWNGRRWVSAPVRRSERLRREAHLLRRALPLLAARPKRHGDEEAQARSLEEADRALERLAARLRPEIVDWHRGEFAALAGESAVAVVEHGDFVTGNLLVDDEGELVALDASGGWAIPGRDSVLLVLDLFGLRAGAKAPDVGAGLRELVRAASAGERAATLAAELLDEEIGLRDDLGRASRLVVLAVLRHYGARGALHGMQTFAARAAAGDLEALLRRLRDHPRAGRR